MARNDDILKKFESLKKNDQFKVPDGYFDKLPGNVMDRIKQEEGVDLGKQTNETRSKRPVISLVRNQLAIAASFAALFLLAYTAIRIIAPQAPNNALSEIEIIASLEAEIHDLDEVYLYNLVFSNETISKDETIELSDQEIMNYLIEEGVDLDFNNFDF